MRFHDHRPLSVEGALTTIRDVLPGVSRWRAVESRISRKLSEMLGTRRWLGLLGRSAFGDGYPIDDPLHQNHLEIYVAGQVGNKFGNCIPDGVGRKRDG